jgi:hypothetical protein
MSEKKVVLITGVSSGIGQAAARLLAQRDFTVFGTARNPSGVEAMPGVEVLPLDVRSDESVNTCVNTVLKRADRLDILVNNAGYLLIGLIEEATLEEAKAQFETNFFGAVRMVKTVLPIMRRQGNGQIINISSGVGLVPLPFAGFYSASNVPLIRSAPMTHGGNGPPKYCDNMKKRGLTQHRWPNASCALSKANRLDCATSSVRKYPGPFLCGLCCRNRCSNRERGAIYVWTSRNREERRGKSLRAVAQTPLLKNLGSEILNFVKSNEDQIR